MRQATKYHKVVGTFISESEKAIRFEVFQVGEKKIDPPKVEWFPKSQMGAKEMITDVIGEDILTVSEWILTTKGYI